MMADYTWGDLNLSPDNIASASCIEGCAITNLPTQFICSDSEVKGFDNPLKVLDLDVELKLYESKSIKRCDIEYEYVTFIGSNQELLFGINCNYKGCYNTQFLVFICEDYYVIVGTVGEHPLVETPYLQYYNSDGSGPDILYENNDHILKGESTNPNLLIGNIAKYYHSFAICDDYH